MKATIHRTTVAPTERGSIVQLYISDAALEAETAENSLQLTISLPKYAGPILLAQAQREAIRTAQEMLRQQADCLVQEIGETDLDPKPLPLVLKGG